MSEMYFEVESNVDFDNTMDVNQYTEILKEEINATFNEATALMDHKAKYDHRYKRRTGILQTATHIQTVGTDITGYISSDADYGKYVHYGHGTWGADPFITDAISEPVIEQAILKAVNKTYEKLFNNSAKVWRTTYGK